jgi:hypothetical protein
LKFLVNHNDWGKCGKGLWASPSGDAVGEFGGFRLETSKNLVSRGDGGYLDRLAFAGGTGKLVLAAIRREPPAEWRRKTRPVRG